MDGVCVIYMVDTVVIGFKALFYIYNQPPTLLYSISSLFFTSLILETCRVHFKPISPRER